MFADLDIFVRVAKAGNMSAVARDMRTSPAAVSKRMGLLESSLGTRLFERSTRRFALTETGEGYLQRAIDILERNAEAENFVRSCTDKPSGLLRVTVPTTFSRLYLASRLPRFLECYPDITLEILVTDDVVDLIHEGFDVAIRIGELSDSLLVARKLSSDMRAICAAPSYLERAGVPKSIKELARHNCLFQNAQGPWHLDGPKRRNTAARQGQHSFKFGRDHSRGTRCGNRYWSSEHLGDRTGTREWGAEGRATSIPGFIEVSHIRCLPKP